MDRYETLQAEGIPARHLRISLHSVVFTAGHLWGWFDDDDRLASEWRRITSIHPENIGCPVEEAAGDIVRHARAADPFEFHLPHAKSLPELDPARIMIAQQRLGAKGCPDPINAARIISRVLYPVIKTCPGYCMGGKASVPSRNMQLACVRQRFKPAMNWLQTNNLLVRTGPHRSGMHSRLYRINVPLILWLLGFRTADLVWKWNSSPAPIVENPQRRSQIKETKESLDGTSVNKGEGQDFLVPSTSTFVGCCATLVDADCRPIQPLQVPPSTLV